MDEIAAYFDERADSWDESGCSGESRVQGAVLSLVDLKPGDSVLDLGCGTGVMIPFYLAAQAGKIVAVDVSEKMVERAREKFGGEPSVELRASDALSLDEGIPHAQTQWTVRRRPWIGQGRHQPPPRGSCCGGELRSARSERGERSLGRQVRNRGAGGHAGLLCVFRRSEIVLFCAWLLRAAGGACARESRCGSCNSQKSTNSSLTKRFRFVLNLR